MPDKVVGQIDKATAKESADVIAKAFPDLSPEQRAALSKRVGDRVSSWSRATVTDAVEAHVRALVNIKETLGAFRPEGAEGDPARADVSAQDVLEVLLEVMDVRLAGGPGGAK